MDPRSPPRERSRALRADFESTALVHVRDRVIKGRAANLSSTGMLVQVPLDAPGGFFVRLQFLVAPRHGSFRGWMDLDALRVRDVIEPERRLWGVKFLQPSPDQTLVLWNFVVQEHLRKLPPAAPSRRPPPLPADVAREAPRGPDPGSVLPRSPSDEPDERRPWPGPTPGRGRPSG